MKWGCISRLNLGSESIRFSTSMSLTFYWDVNLTPLLSEQKRKIRCWTFDDIVFTVLLGRTSSKPVLMLASLVSCMYQQI